MQDKKKIIGIHIGHDSSACLLIGEELVFAEEEERLNRVKNFFGFPTEVLEKIICDYNIKNDGQIDLAVSWDIEEYVSRRKEYINIAIKNKYFEWGKRRNDYLKLKVEFIKMISKIFPNGNIHYFPHHFCHAMSVIPFVQDKENQNFAAIISDAIAEGDSLTVYKDVIKNEISFSADLFDCSLGYFYQRWAEILGFIGRQAPGYLMSLVGIDENKEINELFEEYLIRYKNGWPILNSQVFNPIKGTGVNALNCFDEKFLNKINYDLSIQDFKYKAVFATATQHVLEKIILEQIKILSSLTEIESLLLSGGVFHNCLLVSNIKKSGLFKYVYIGPASKDSGTSIGAAIASYYTLNNRLPNFKANPYLGYNSNNSLNKEFFASLLPYIEIKSEDNIIDSIIDDIYQNKVIGISIDKLEFGPRALGNRSIIGRIDSVDIRYKINNLIKKRFDFQPLAAIMLVADAKEYFDISTADHMMTGIAWLNNQNQEKFIGVLHTNNNCRLQVIEEDNNLFISKILIKMRQLKYLPALINTSFNLKEEPLVRDTNDAIATYLKSEIDYLYTHNFCIKIPISERKRVLNEFKKIKL